ncbi:MAG: hypothetical protein GY826_35780, partial [Fuerstiella sp.]|nr:hypothetical protein [Fuerstiella sp.]
EVKPTDKPIVVALTAYNKTEWHLKIDPKASVRQIIIAGYFEQNLAEPTPDVPIIWQTYFPTADRKQRDYFWAHDWHTKEGKDLRKKLNDMTGLDITTFQAEYHGSLFVIDGKRGNITGLDDETPVSPTAIAGSPEEVDDYVELIEGYVNKLNEATDAGRVDEAEKLKDIIRYMLLAIRIQREQTNSQLTELRQTLKDLNVNGDSRMIERVQAEIRTAEDILATETKYAGFLLPLKSANAP